MNSLLKSALWSLVNSRGLLDELHFAATLGGGVSTDFCAQVRYFKTEHFRRILAESDARYLKHNKVSLVNLIKISDNDLGWSQKADVWVNEDLFAKVQDHLPDVLWVYFPIHDETINIEVLKGG